jgi:tetratricopeptide (TPR) repeat protein
LRPARRHGSPVNAQPTTYDPIAREYRQQATLDGALSLAQEAVALDGNLPEAHTALAQILHWQYRRAESMAEYQRAFELNPNLAERSFAPALYHNGRTPEAIEYIRRIMRLDPFHPTQLFVNLGGAYYLSSLYTEALGPLRTATDRMPDFRPGFVWRAAAAAQLGLDEEARQAASGVLRLQPDFKISEWLRFLRLAKQEDADRLADGLRKAGWRSDCTVRDRTTCGAGTMPVPVTPAVLSGSGSDSVIRRCRLNVRFARKRTRLSTRPRRRKYHSRKSHRYIGRQGRQPTGNATSPRNPNEDDDYEDEDEEDKGQAAARA